MSDEEKDARHRAAYEKNRKIMQEIKSESHAKDKVELLRAILGVLEEIRDRLSGPV